MVSTQDSESCDPSSNLGGTLNIFKSYFLDLNFFILHYCDKLFIWGRDSSVGRALDWRSKGPRFDPGSRQFCQINFLILECQIRLPFGQQTFLILWILLKTVSECVKM